MHHDAFPLPDLGGQVLDVDLCDGAWVAAVQESPGLVFAAWDGGRSETQRANYPLIRRGRDGRVLLVDARTAGGKNGWWLDPGAGIWQPVFVGDAVEDLAVVGDRIAVAFFDEAYGSSNGHFGFAVLAGDGSTIWSSRDAGMDVFDVSCMCASGRMEVLFVDYPSWAVIRLNVKTRALHTTRLPNALAGPGAITSLGDRLCVHGSYAEPAALVAWREGRTDTHVIGTHPGSLRGIGQGRFLATGASGYTVVDVSEDLKHIR